MTAAAAPSSLPLHGIRVLDLSRVFAAPLCSQVLGDFGAEVIKVEHPERGDDTRDWGLRIGQTETTYYNSMNRNKRSVTLNLKSAQGVQIVRDLLLHCDVVLHNFKHGTAEKLGLGYEALRALKPTIIYCAITGYDSSGPEAARPGYDLLIQAESGLMFVNGEEGTPPLKFGVAVVDMMTGMSAAQAVLAALVGRGRTGQGCRMDLALYDSGLNVSSYYGLEALKLGRDPLRAGNNHPSIMPYGLFEAADGPLIIAVGNNAQFGRFCRQVIGCPDMAEDPRFVTNTARAQNRAALLPLLTQYIGALPRSVLLERMRAAGVPGGEVAGLHDALTSERTRSSRMVQEVPHPVAGSTPLVAPTQRLNGQRLPIRHAPPTLGEGTREVLQTLLGMEEERLQQLQAQGVLTMPQG